MVVLGNQADDQKLVAFRHDDRLAVHLVDTEARMVEPVLGSCSAGLQIEYNFITCTCTSTNIVRVYAIQTQIAF